MSTVAETKTFKFRAETLHDVVAWLEVLRTSKNLHKLKHYKIASLENRDSDQRPYLLPDVEVTFVTTDPNGHRGSLSEVADGHVMVETLALASHYTGERP